MNVKLSISDWNPCDFDVFHRNEFPIIGIRFASNIHSKEAEENQIIMINTQYKLHGIEKLPERWRKVIDGYGEYIQHDE